ncbi:MAG TPA: DUF308 domain-containing protein [Acidobacteriaceae bacterium]|nr:DUF308 domain-containing protein [Acidobacteriaceae bacterium]
MDEPRVGSQLRKASSWAIAWAVLIIIAGIIAVSLPLLSGLGVAIVVGWLLVISGIFHLIDAFHAKATGAFFWRLLVGGIYLIGGFDIAVHPAFGLITLTLVLGIILIMQGIIGIVGFFGYRSLPGAYWILLNAIFALGFGIFIWWDGARAAVWVIGTLVGFTLIFSGVTRLLIWGSVHKALRSSGQ